MKWLFFILFFSFSVFPIEHIPNMERLGNERLETEIARIWDNVKASEARGVSVSSAEYLAQPGDSNSKAALGRREHDMAIAKKTISRRWGEQNASKLWPYVTSYSMVCEMRTATNTGISFEKAFDRVLLDWVVEDQQMPVVNSAAPSQNYQFILETFRDKRDSSKTHTPSSLNILVNLLTRILMERTK